MWCGMVISHYFFFYICNFSFFLNLIIFCKNDPKYFNLISFEFVYKTKSKWWMLPEIIKYAKLWRKMPQLSGNCHIRYGNMRWQKKLFNLGYKLSKAFPFPVLGSKYVPRACVRVTTKSIEFRMRYPVVHLHYLEHFGASGNL